MVEVPLLEKTRALLEKCDLPLPELANMSGLGYEWLKWFKRGDIDDPSVNRIQKLHDFLVSIQTDSAA